MQETKQILLKILDIVGYTGDKEAFVDKTIHHIYMHSFFELIKDLPIDEQTKIKRDWSGDRHDAHNLTDVLKNYFTEDKIFNSVVESSKQIFSDYMQQINKVITPNQRKQLSEMTALQNA